jgi:hypothetical protein
VRVEQPHRVWLGVGSGAVEPGERPLVRRRARLFQPVGDGLSGSGESALAATLVRFAGQPIQAMSKMRISSAASSRRNEQPVALAECGLAVCGVSAGRHQVRVPRFPGQVRDALNQGVESGLRQSF